MNYRHDNYYVEADVLSKNNIRLPAGTVGQVNVNRLPEVSAEYDPSQQQLKLTVPVDWLPAQRVTSDGSGTERLVPSSSLGLLFNYNAYYSSPSNGDDSLSAWMEQRVFSDYGSFSNTGIDDIMTGNHSDQYHRYRRFDTYWRYSDSGRMISYQAGDLVSNSLTWSHSVRMGGVRISRNFGLRPDIVTYPLLQYSGSAAVPSTLDLFINGYKANSSNLNPGPFTLTNTPYLNGAGEATVVTTDAQGRRIATTIPFYVSNTLLRAGLSDFDLSMGALRHDYGFRNAAYASEPAFSGIYRYGLTNWLTLSTHVETERDLYLAGMGADFTVGRWGTLSSSYTQSERDGRGQQYTLGYSYYTRLFGLNVQHAGRDQAYRDLTAVNNEGRLSRQSNQATLSSQLFGKGNGTVGAGYFDIQSFDRSRVKLLNLSYSRQLWQSSSVYAALNKTLGEDDYSVQIQFVMPFGTRNTASSGVQRDANGNYSARVGMTHSAPTDGGFGWNLAYAAGGNPYQQGTLSWRGPYNLIQGGVYGNEGNSTRWGELSGSLIYMDGGLYASNRINDAFIVVDTAGYAGVPVKYENQLVGATNGSGHLLVPWVASNYPAKVEIDPMPLPANVDTPNIEQRVSVKEGSGIVVKFPVRNVLSANIALRNSHGRPLAIGTWITDEYSGAATISGHDGLAYFSNLRTVNRLHFKQEDGQTCQVAFSLPATARMMVSVGPLTCQLTAQRDKDE
ncbi:MULTISPECIES: fimbria/pilus outer membrane usher protein [unclassified Brenneria]|uniref:fimbria/pilus outer membrane usher protein n=1 Tax=unclassified Brenneria TaxID=2634434 RepID=UPI0029C483D4|nr:MULTISPECIES: fimbria/pilus outer membrane usher protein [unclassified Brenneria]MDX5629274.1 fimbria/pilus outer membrane usher protein [Brenneria sp. L3-3Z]MDX5696413.1 fimbria/pilus outer membrane usher protein [Brenneria sp. L4-2C]